MQSEEQVVDKHESVTSFGWLGVGVIDFGFWPRKFVSSSDSGWTVDDASKCRGSRRCPLQAGRLAVRFNIV